MKYKLIILIILLFSCNNTKIKKVNKNQDYFIEFFYHDQGVKYPMRYTCGKLKSGNINSKPNYKKIKNKEYVQKIISYYSNLENNNEERFDARIHFLVHHEKKVDTICMGEYFGIVVNGVTKVDSKEFIDFIKEEIYKK